MKNLIYAGVIILCLVVAGVLIFARGGKSGGIDSLSNDEQIWVLCMECNASYEMGKKDYYTQIREKAQESTSPLMVQYLTCQKCGKDAVIEAVKCEKCGNIFRKNSVPNDNPDRCPKCKFSKIEAIRKERLAK